MVRDDVLLTEKPSKKLIDAMARAMLKPGSSVNGYGGGWDAQRDYVQRAWKLKAHAVYRAMRVHLRSQGK